LRGLIVALCLLLSMGFLLTGCSSQEGESFTYQIPWLNKDGSYSLQSVELRGLKRANLMSGSAANIYFDADLEEDGFRGKPALVQVTKAGGVWVPRNYKSLLAISSYAHYQSLRELDEDIGFGGGVRWPREVGLEMKLQNDDGSTDVDNARYYGVLDATAVSISKNVKLPLALNGGVLGHEHFHAHFASQVTMPLLGELNLENALRLTEKHYMLALGSHQEAVEAAEPTEVDDVVAHNFIVLRGWNEGLADVWGMVYSRDRNSFGQSLPSLAELRSLELDWEPLISGSDFEEGLESGKLTVLRDDKEVVLSCSPICHAYRMGTQIARFLSALSRDSEITYNQVGLSTLQNERALGAQILTRMPELLEWVTEKMLKEKMKPVDLLNILLGEGVELTPSGCEQLNTFLEQAENKDLAEGMCP
jgi:hypothetical protein